ncbi:hypothetical protein ACWDKQ_31475 [Saccharopolyspora sp. NPDC000995]
MSNTTFFFGVLPGLNENTSHFGITDLVGISMLAVGDLTCAYPI